MALTPKEIKEAVALLKQQAEEQAKISNSLEGYIEGLKKVKAIDEEVNRLRKIQADILAKARTLTGTAKTDELKKLAILRKQTNELHNQGKELKENLKTVNKSNLLIAKTGASMVKGFAKLPDLIENIYGKIKNSGLFEMDKAVKQSALNMGLMTQNSKSFSNDIRQAAKQTTMIGVGMQDLAKMQSDYSEELGRAVMLNESGLKAMGELAAATALGVEGAAKMAADMEQQGFSAERTRDFIEETMNNSSKMGLNASKVVKNIQQNMKLLNKYNFKGGVKGLAKMAETTSKLGVDMNFATSMADKLFDIEGAVEMSAQLQVLGGAWSKLADPFHLMYMARNDMAGLTEEIGQAAASSAKFNKANGEFEISSLEMHRLRKIAEQTGLSYEDLATAGKNAAKFSKIKGQVGFAMSDDAKEFLTNTAKLDKDGRASIEVMVNGKSTKKFLNELSKAEVEKLINEKKTLKERAEEAQTFDESFTNLINSFKVSLLPLIDTMNEKLVPKLLKLGETFNAKGGWGEKVEKIATVVGNLISTVGGLMIDNPIGTAITLAAAKFTGFILDKASWFANGIMLAKGFNSATGGGGFGTPGGSIGPPLPPSMSGSGGKFGKFGKLSGGMSFGKSLTKGLKLGGGLGAAGLLLSGARGLIDDPNSEGGKLLGVGSSASEYASYGAMLGSVIPGLGTAAGAIIGGVLGAGKGVFDEYYSDDSKNSKGGAVASMGDGIIFDAKDKFMKLNDGTMIAGTQKGGNKALADEIAGNSSKTMKIEFGEIHFKFDELKVVSPGSPGLAINVMKDPIFIRDLTRVIQNETQKALKGGKN